MTEIRTGGRAQIDIGAVRNIVMQKAWYGMNPNTGSFDFSLSVGKMAESLHVSPELTKEAMVSAFTPECLAQVTYRSKANDAESVRTPLLEALRSADFAPHIWTVGDPAWQRAKYERSGAAHYVGEDHYHCYEADKLKGLEGLIDKITAGNSRTKVLVADDKWENVSGVRDIAERLKQRGVTMIDYHMKLNDPNADATAFLNWVLNQNLAAQKEQEKLEIILDFDGVVADTDGVLKGKVVENLFKLANSVS